jgi:hypothetical protein
MNYLPQVISAKRVRGFVIATRFDDGSEKHLDISQLFKPLKDPKFFAKFFIESGTLAWPNGVDIAPEALYDATDIRIKSKTKNKRKAHPGRPDAK